MKIKQLVLVSGLMACVAAHAATFISGDKWVQLATSKVEADYIAATAYVIAVADLGDARGEICLPLYARPSDVTKIVYNGMTQAQVPLAAPAALLIYTGLKGAFPCKLI